MYHDNINQVYKPCVDGDEKLLLTTISRLFLIVITLICLNGSHARPCNHQPAALSCEGIALGTFTHTQNNTNVTNSQLLVHKQRSFLNSFDSFPPCYVHHLDEIFVNLE